MRRRIVFHIGLAKTGTTTFQHFCHGHRALLKRHGVLYPRRQSGYTRNHSPLVASYIAHRPEGPTVAVRWKPRTEAVASLIREIDASPTEVILISSEHFSMHFDRSEAKELAADFSAYDCSILIALRDPHARFLSAYNTHVTAGGCLSIEDYARSVLVPGTRYMSAKETVLIWEEAFGRDRIQIVDYDAVPDISAALLGPCGIHVPLPEASRARRRGSLAPDAIELLRGANARIASRQAVPAAESLAAWAQLSAFSILCRRRIVRSEIGGGRAEWIVGEATMQALDAIAEADRAWIGDAYGITLRGAQARGRMKVDVSDLAGAYSLSARSLADGVTRGLWRPSQMLVALWERLSRSKRGVG